MRRVWWLIVGIVLLAIFSVILLISIYLKTGLTQFSVQNNIPGYNFGVSANAANLFIKTQGYKNNFKNITVIFTQQPQHGMSLWLEGPAAGPTSSMDGKINGNFITIWEQYSTNALISAMGGADVHGQKINLDEDLYTCICVSLDPAKPTVEQCRQKAKNYMGKLPSFPQVKLVTTAKKLSFRLVDTVKADCSGTIPCGEEMGGLFCSQKPSERCDNNNYCSFNGWGICEYQSYCDTSRNGLNCSFLDQGNCRFAGTCRSCWSKCNITCTDIYCSWQNGGGFCGDGICGAGENCDNCSKDCPYGCGGGGGGAYCGDGNCDAWENGCTCPHDCGYSCPTPPPTSTPLPGDCPNGTCDPGEDSCNCPVDCPGTCNPVYDPVGYHDSSDGCGLTYGWACDGSNYSQPLAVQFYLDGDPGTGTFIGSALADVYGQDLVDANVCGGTGNHRFNFPTPDWVKQLGGSHTIFAYAINIGTGTNRPLYDTPKSISCDCAPTPTCTIDSNAFCHVLPDGSAEILTNWAVNSVNFPIVAIQGRFNKYADAWPGPGDLSLNWGTGFSGYNSTAPQHIDYDTVYSTSVGVYNAPIDGTWNNFICKTEPSQLITCPKPIPSCDVYITPNNVPYYDMLMNQSAFFTANVSNLLNGTFNRVQFSSNNTGVLWPTGECVPPYSCKFTAVGVKDDTATLTADVYMNDVEGNPVANPVCTGTQPVRIIGSVAWWQVKDADVATNSDINSSIPNTVGLFFDATGANFPGVPAYKGVTNLTFDKVSETHWLANSGYDASKRYDFNYFYSAIPSGLTPQNIPLNSEPGGYFTSGGTPDSQSNFWYEYDGSGDTFTISSLANLGARKVILLVKNANVQLNGQIHLTKGSGFFLLATSGNITVNPNSVGGGGAANLEGIFIADGKFHTGSKGTNPGTDSELWVRGTIVTYGGMDLLRDLGYGINSTTPGELFELAPDLILHFPNAFGVHNMSWQEVAP